MNLFEKYITPIVCLVSFLIGIWVCYAWTSFKQAFQLREIQTQVVKQQEINRKTVEDLQTINATNEVKYAKLKDELNEKPITNVPCNLTNNAVRVWNQSKGIKSQLPTNPTRIVESATTTNSPDTIPSEPIEGVGIKLVLDNALANDKICNDMRDQINSIIKWEEDTYGK